MGQRSTRSRGSIERLRSGSFRVVVRAGKDPITGRYLKVAETHPTEDAARKALERLVAQIDSDQIPDRAATVSVLMKRWMDVVDHELSTRETTAGYVRRTIDPALGDMSLRKLQHRVDLLDRLYIHLRRCNVICDGRPYVEHQDAGAHDCEAAKCLPHHCKPMAPSTVRRIHAIISSALGYAVSWPGSGHPPRFRDAAAR